MAQLEVGKPASGLSAGLSLPPLAVSESEAEPQAKLMTGPRPRGPGASESESASTQPEKPSCRGLNSLPVVMAAVTVTDDSLATGIGVNDARLARPGRRAIEAAASFAGSVPTRTGTCQCRGVCRPAVPVSVTFAGGLQT